jgi:hypothetical protein
LAVAPYEALRSEIAALVDAGCGLAEIEDEIAAGQLSDEYSAALWLLAWSRRELPVKSSPPSLVEERQSLVEERQSPDRQLPRLLQGDWRR